MTSENITSATITTADLAGRYKSTAGSQEGGDVALVKSIMEQVDAQGYVIIKNLFSVETMDALKADVLPRFKHATGRNNFEGLATQRIYSMMAETDIANPMVEHPLIMGLLDKIFEPNYLLSQLPVSYTHLTLPTTPYV